MTILFSIAKHGANIVGATHGRSVQTEVVDGGIGDIAKESRVGGKIAAGVDGLGSHIPDGVATTVEGALKGVLLGADRLPILRCQNIHIFRRDVLVSEGDVIRQFESLGAIFCQIGTVVHGIAESFQLIE